MVLSLTSRMMPGSQHVCACLVTKSRLTLCNPNLNIQKTKIMASGPLTSWGINGETVEAVSGFILGDGGGPKSLQMVIQP